MRLWWPCPICCNGKNVNRLLAVVDTQRQIIENQRASLEYTKQTIDAYDELLLLLRKWAALPPVGVGRVGEC